MKFQAHRGVGTEFPENTMPAFIAAAAQGYDYIELDPAFTADGKCVIMHDKSINRTCRDKKGTAIKNEIMIADISYEQALQYDAGIAKAYKFRGTQIPLLAEALKFAKNTGLTVKLDNTIQYFSDIQTDIFFDTVEKSGAHVGFTSTDTEYIKKVVARFPNVEIHYDGYVDENRLIELREILKDNELYIWLPVPSPATDWVNVPRADGSLCKTVKKYGKLGLWIISDTDGLETAKKFGADIIETPGQIKPENKGNSIFDCHTHTHFSHDSECDPHDSLKAAKEKGIAGFAITDHCDIEYCKLQDVKTPIKRSADCAHEMGDGVLAGVEIGEGIWHKKDAEEVLAGSDFDIVLGSVHAVRYKSYTMPYSQMDFSVFSQDEINEYISAYFDDMLEMIKTTDFDVLSHLTCPLRYISGKYGIAVDLKNFADKTDIILNEIINRGVALEINTSCLDTNYNALMPDIPIIKRYKELGGYLLTLGSDAHIAKRIAHGFDYALSELSRLGFKNIYYYKNRKPIPQEIKL